MFVNICAIRFYSILFYSVSICRLGFKYFTLSQQPPAPTSQTVLSGVHCLPGLYHITLGSLTRSMRGWKVSFHQKFLKNLKKVEPTGTSESSRRENLSFQTVLVVTI